MNGIKNHIEFRRDCFRCFSYLKRDLLRDELTLGLWNELLLGPLHPTASNLPGLRGCMEQDLCKDGQYERDGADDVDHNMHGEATCCLDFPDGVCILWDGLHQDGEHHYARDQVDEVENVCKALLGP